MTAGVVRTSATPGGYSSENVRLLAGRLAARREDGEQGDSLFEVRRASGEGGDKRDKIQDELPQFQLRKHCWGAAVEAPGRVCVCVFMCVAGRLPAHKEGLCFSPSVILT